MKKNILILKQICKCIQKKTVLNQFYMNIQNGEIVNLIGMEDRQRGDRVQSQELYTDESKNRGTCGRYLFYQ